MKTLTAALLTVATLAACAVPPGKDEIEAAKNTYACQLAGERLVVRFDTGEVRLLMPDGNRVTLHQIPSGSGLRYSNGLMELHGKGTALQLIQDGVATALAGCEQFPVPK
jgi:membrane-bound inhibitor of C-type lysozyme